MVAGLLGAAQASGSALERLLTPGPVSQAHAKLECKGCHVKSPDQVRLATECGACHRRDDVHQRRFGGDCGRCHSTTSFAKPRVLQ